MVKELYFLTAKNLRIRRDSQGKELKKDPYSEDENLKFIVLSVWQSYSRVQSIPLSDHMNTQLAHRYFKKADGMYLRAEIIL